MQRKYLLAAVKQGMIIPADVSLKLYEKNRPLFYKVLGDTSKPFKQYDALPRSILKNINTRTAILKSNKFDEGTWAFRFSKDIPTVDMRKHIAPLMKMAKNESVSQNEESAIWDVKSIVLSLCKINGNLFPKASQRLREDIDLAKAAFSDGTVSLNTIKKCPQSLFQANHDLAALALTAYDNFYSHWERFQVLTHLGVEVTSSRVIFLAFVKKGWSFRGQYRDQIPFRNDLTFALEAIKNAKSIEKLTEILNVFSSDHALRDNKQFMLSAVEANPEVIKCASKYLMEDFDFLLRAISVSRATLVHFCHKGNDFDLLADFAAVARETLALTDGVVLHFFGAMCIDPASSGGKKRAKRRRTGRTSDNCCYLRLLDLGGEGGIFIKRTIAEYADIPVGLILKLTRRALENVEFWGY
jgi:hypothetical protein